MIGFHDDAQKRPPPFIALGRFALECQECSPACTYIDPAENPFSSFAHWVDVFLFEEQPSVFSVGLLLWFYISESGGLSALKQRISEGLRKRGKLRHRLLFWIHFRVWVSDLWCCAFDQSHLWLFAECWSVAAAGRMKCDSESPLWEIDVWVWRFIRRENSEQQLVPVKVEPGSAFFRWMILILIYRTLFVLAVVCSVNGNVDCYCGLMMNILWLSFTMKNQRCFNSCRNLWSFYLRLVEESMIRPSGNSPHIQTQTFRASGSDTESSCVCSVLLHWYIKYKYCVQQLNFSKYQELSRPDILLLKIFQASSKDSVSVWLNSAVSECSERTQRKNGKVHSQ